MVRAVLVLGMLGACGFSVHPARDGGVADDVATDATATDATDATDSPAGNAFTATPASATLTAVVSSTAHATVIFTNTAGSASAPVTLALGGANPSVFAVESSTCTGALGASAACTVGVAFTPTTAGTFTASLTLSDGASTATATVTGSGTTVAAGLTVSPAFVDAGSACLGSTGSLFSSTVTNQGAAPTGALVVSLIGAQAGEFTIANDTCNGAIVPGHGTCSFSVGVRPTGIGVRSASARVTDPATNAMVSATLTGVGLSCSGMTITPSLHDFGTVTVGDTAFAYELTVTNTGGTTTGTIATATGGPNVGDFLKMADNCAGQTLGPGAACTLFVAFEPGAAGMRTATVSAVATPGGTVTANLSGTGQ
jgi:hypothetical protein